MPGRLVEAIQRRMSGGLVLTAPAWPPSMTVAEGGSAEVVGTAEQAVGTDDLDGAVPVGEPRMRAGDPFRPSLGLPVS